MSKIAWCHLWTTPKSCTVIASKDSGPLVLVLSLIRSGFNSWIKSLYNINLLTTLSWVLNGMLVCRYYSKKSFNKYDGVKERPLLNRRNYIWFKMMILRVYSSTTLSIKQQQKKLVWKNFFFGFVINVSKLWRWAADGTAHVLQLESCRYSKEGKNKQGICLRKHRT